ncbi:MAG: acyl-CoA dehydrogenase family protein [Maricaulaceae bacterium]
MDFRYTEDQQDLIDAAKAVFDGENTPERMRALVSQEKGSEEVADLWPQFAELGLLGLMAPESAGGLEQNLAVMAGVAEAAGYAGLPEGFVEMAGISIPCLIEATIDGELLSDVINGTKRVAVQSDIRPYIHAAGKMDYFLCADDCTARADSEVTPVKSIDPLRDIARVSPTGIGSDLAKNNGAVLSAAQLVGLSKRMIDMSVEYAKDRHQFGKPIGSFQAIKHHLATAYTQIEFTRPMVHLAALQGGRAVHTAKIAAIDMAMLAGETAIQVHGGMGYTFEVDLHLFMKRAWALCGEWGDRNYHMKQLENLVLGGNTPLGAGTTF